MVYCSSDLKDGDSIQFHMSCCLAGAQEGRKSSVSETSQSDNNTAVKKKADGGLWGTLKNVVG